MSQSDSGLMRACGRETPPLAPPTRGGPEPCLTRFAVCENAHGTELPLTKLNGTWANGAAAFAWMRFVRMRRQSSPGMSNSGRRVRL